MVLASAVEGATIRQNTSFLLEENRHASLSSKIHGMEVEGREE